ncbi:MAG TPA: shikimate kinase [Oscillospiraceae bacterium]|nr:shikimate kinase [Oscillospiraceae bacterium]
MEKFGLIGQPLGHSFSPEIHSHLGDYEYKLYPLLQTELKDFMHNNPLSGFNVTIPYKTDVISFCNELSEKAAEIQSVNTIIKRADGSYFGDNTDYYGFLDLLGDNAKKIKGKKTLILGSGGTEKTVRTALLDMGASPVITISRSGKDNYDNISNHHDAFAIINTTPVGMYPENGKSAITLEHFTKCKLVIDMIYNPAKTKLLLDAEKLRIPYSSGLYMLVSQAKRASEIFQNKSIPHEKVLEITSTISRKTKNIVLIGMPGSGKTSIGKALAKISNRPFLDTDDIIANEKNIDASHILSTKGESFFRKIETEVLQEVTKLSGAIISVGGGVVTVPCNHALLHQNSTVVLIERDLGKLSIKNRPISQEKGIKELYRERKMLYKSFSDYTFHNHNINKTAKMINSKLLTHN